MYAFFKKRDKQFVGFTEKAPNPAVYLSKDVGDIDPLEKRWLGTYEEGEVVPIDTPINDYTDKYHVYESDVKGGVGRRINSTHKLPTHKQINAIMEQINYMCEQLNIKRVDNFANCYDTIIAELESMKKFISNAKAHPDQYEYITKDKVEKYLVDRFV